MLTILELLVFLILDGVFRPVVSVPTTMRDVNLSFRRQECGCVADPGKALWQRVRLMREE